MGSWRRPWPIQKKARIMEAGYAGMPVTEGLKVVAGEQAS